LSAMAIERRGVVEERADRCVAVVDECDLSRA
jgi:hypothetical protein